MNGNKMKSENVNDKENIIIEDVVNEDIVNVDIEIEDIEDEGIEIVYDPLIDDSVKPKKKMKKWQKAILIVVSTILSLIALVAILFVGLRISGKSSIYSKAESEKPNLSKNDEDKDKEEIDIPHDDLGNITIINNDSDDELNSDNSSLGINSNSNNPEFSFEGVDSESGYDVIYKDDKYKYNKDIMTFLFLGIDEEKSIDKTDYSKSGGQSDALFLLVMNPHTMVMDVIAIHRNTVTKLWLYDNNDNYTGTGYAQICLQHAYGDGKTVSNERTVKAVSNMLYDLPIHGCTSINMGAISELNDAIGGITLNSIETFESRGYKFVKGESVKLNGDKAYAYVRYRDLYRKQTTAERLSRQKQYINIYINKAMEEMKSDIGKVVDVYDVIKRYVVTDFSLDEMTYLASEAVSYKFGGMYSFDGEVLKNDKFKYERFYLDEKQVAKLIIDKFYEKVE